MRPPATSRGRWRKLRGLNEPRNAGIASLSASVMGRSKKAPGGDRDANETVVIGGRVLRNRAAQVAPARARASRLVRPGSAAREVRRARAVPGAGSPDRGTPRDRAGTRPRFRNARPDRAPPRGRRFRRAPAAHPDRPRGSSARAPRCAPGRSRPACRPCGGGGGRAPPTASRPRHRGRRDRRSSPCKNCSGAL